MERSNPHIKYLLMKRIFFKFIEYKGKNNEAKS